MKIALSNIEQNPYRDLERNPLVPKKIEELRASIQQTGYWDNVVVRKHPSKPGKFQLAYGHHRFEAAKLEDIKEADFIVKNFDEALMIKVMKSENNEAYSYSLLSYLEAVRAVVNALADGKLTSAIVPRNEVEAAKKKYTFVISKDTPKALIRYAPRFTPGEILPPSNLEGRAPYTILAVAEFLGYTERAGKGIQADDNIQAAFRALYLIQEKEGNPEARLRYEEMLSKWSTALLIKNTQEDFDRLLEDRKERAEKAKVAEGIAKANADTEAFDAEAKANREAAAEAVKTLDDAAAKAKLDEDIKTWKAAEEKKQKLLLDVATNELKQRVALTEEIIKAYSKLVAPEDLAKLNKELESVEKTLQTKDVKKIDKATDKLVSLGSSLTQLKVNYEKKKKVDVAAQKRVAGIKEQLSILVSFTTEYLATTLDQRIKTIIAAEKGVPDLQARKVAVEAIEAGMKLMGLRIATLENVPQEGIKVLTEMNKKEDSKRGKA